MGCLHAATKATEAAAPEATEAATTAPRRIAGTPTLSYFRVATTGKEVRRPLTLDQLTFLTAKSVDNRASP